MKAIVIDRFGGAETLRLDDIQAPIPGPSEVLIRVSHAGVNPVDWKIREGHLTELLPHKFPLVLGWEAVGEVVEVGPEVARFKKGDRVFSYCRKPEVQWGAYAELVAVNADHVAPAPRTLSDAQAAGVPLAALTAWQSLFDVAKIQKGSKVLVHAGAGGVGGFALQLAKLAGAMVLTTARAEKHAYVKQLGADTAIDYTTENVGAVVRDFAPEGLDVVFDCVGGDTLDRSFPLVKRGGRLISIVETPDSRRAESLGIHSCWVFVNPNGEELSEISRRFDAHELVAPAVEVLPLASAAEAHEKSQSRRQMGKLVLKI